MIDETLKEITKKIRQRREELEYSQEYMAYKLKISQKTYSKIELNQIELRLDEFLKICEVLAINTKELFGNIRLNP